MKFLQFQSIQIILALSIIILDNKTGPSLA